MLINKKTIGVLAAVFFGLAVAVPLALARMDPLREIKAQIKRPNMLIILDTSGSMSWRPQDSTVVGGDTSTSRLYLAKRVINNTIRDNHNLLNFGLMTYAQTHYQVTSTTKGYFPYYLGSSTSTTKSIFFTDNQLKDWGFFTLTSGPAATFTRSGTAYTLKSTNNSQFRRGYWFFIFWIWVTTDHSYNYSGDHCTELSGNVYCTFSGYTWEYRGSYYTYEERTVTSTLNYFTQYYGRQFVQGSNYYVYYTFPNDYMNSSTPINYIDDTGGILLERISTDPAVQETKYNRIASWMNLQNEGGLVARGNTPTGLTLKNNNTDPLTEKLFTNADGTSPLIGDGTASPPSTVTWGGKTWTRVAAGTGGGNSNYSGGSCGRHDWVGKTYSCGFFCTCTFAGAYYNEALALPLYNDAFSYFKNEVIANDDVSKAGCRKNFILLVTDGEPNGPAINSTTCNPSSWRTSGDPSASKCAAYDLFHLSVGGSSTPVVTYVIGFGADTTGSANLDSIAQQGGSPLKADGHYAYFAGNEAELTNAIQTIINEAAQGDYTTAPPSYTFASSGTGTVVFFSSARYPEWYGHLRAMNVSVIPPVQLWDAGSLLNSARSASRRIYTYDPDNPSYPMSFTTTNLTKLNTMGLGASEAEARAIILFTRGVARNNYLGDIINSAPATLVPPPWRRLSTRFHYDVFFDDYASGTSRNIVVLTGANDGMLHAFTLDGFTDKFTSEVFRPGDEVWAFIPPDQIPRLRYIYLNGGQARDPDSHIYYVAASPKMQDIYDEANCTSADGYHNCWKTILISGEGRGGSQYFALDITHPSPNDINFGFGQTPKAPFKILWTTHGGGTDPNAHKTGLEGLGETWSNPAFGKVLYTNGLGVDVTEDAIFVGSGYDDVHADASNHLTNHGGVGTTIYIINVLTGSVIKSFNVGNATGTPVTEFSLLANTVSYGYGSMFDWSHTTATGEDAWNLSDLIQVSLDGRVWNVTTSDSHTLLDWVTAGLYSAGGNYPFYYSPAMARVAAAGGVDVLAGISGTYYDQDMDPSGLTPKLFLWYLQKDSGVSTLNDFAGYPKLINSLAFPLYKLNPVTKQRELQTGTFTPPASARPTGSPLLAVADNGDVAVILTLFIPPTSASPCSYGEGYLAILKITGLSGAGGPAGATITTVYSEKVAESLPQPPFIIQGALVVTESGHGSASASVNTIGNPNYEGSTFTQENGDAKFLYWKEVR